MPTLAIILGFIVLVWSADRFVAGSASIAKKMGMSSLMIGITVVSIGTSAPEILVSLIAAINGSVDISAGNAVGSNITNVGLVLGITALIAPIPVKGDILKHEFPILMIVSLFAGLCLWNLKIDLIEGVGLLLGLAILLFYLLRYRATTNDQSLGEEVAELTTLTRWQAWSSFFLGLLLLIASSQILVW